jgi:polar amino acid transport system substrate-binding protein
MIKKMKIRHLRLVFLAATLFLLSCGNKNGSSTEGSKNTLANIISAKELKVGYLIFEPTVMKDPKTDSLKGVFVDMVYDIAKSLDTNMKVTFVPTNLANFSADLAARKFDISIVATFATPKRASMVAFTRPLFYCGYTGVTKKENKEKYSTWSAIDQPNVSIGLLQGSAIADLAKREFKNKNNLQLFPGSDLTIPLVAVSSGKADVGLMNQITVFTYLREHPELTEVMGQEPLATTYFAWAVRPDDLILLNFLNTSIDYLKNSGRMLSYQKKYNVPLMQEKTTYYFPNN